MPIPSAWASAVPRWQDAMRARGMSEATIRTRTDHVRRAARALGGEPWSVTADDVVSWVGRQSWQRETRRSVYASLRSWWGWAVEVGLIAESPAAALPRVRATEPRPRPAPDDVMQTAVRMADERTRLILRCAAEVGLRRGEIARIRLDDIEPDLYGWSLRVRGKGQRVRVVPLPDMLARDLRRACMAGGGWALPGAVDGHLSPEYVGRLATRVMPGVWTLHTLRHRFASRAHDATHDLIAVQHLLGHASVSTTQRYVATSDLTLRRAMEAAA